MPATLHPLPDLDVAAFSAGTADPTGLEERLTRYLASGTVRPEWCWIAEDAAGGTLARHYWWGRPGSAGPFGVDHVSAEDHEAAVGLMVHARDRLEVGDAWCEVTCPVEEGADPSRVQSELVAVLGDCGYGFEVARVGLEWTTGTRAPADSGRLVLRPARSLDEGLLVSVFRQVADGSLDHGMVATRGRIGAAEEAAERLGAVRSYPGEADWFSVAFDPDGRPVGYVVPGLAGAVPMVGEIGVVASRRGQGYVDDLLSWATRLLAGSGARRIIADTDRANTPMRAAFERGGYREVRWRDDYRWRRDDR